MNVWKAAVVAHLTLMASVAFCQVETKELEYSDGKTKLKGFMAFDKSKSGKLPGLLVVHEWWGHNDHARTQAKKFAGAGFAAFALDMYGAGKSTTHPKDAGAFMNEVMKSPDVMASRFKAALELLKKQPNVDPSRIAAVGYCFGGTVSLTMARAGEDLKAVATFHAALAPVGATAKKGTFKPKVLVQTGGADPMIPAAQVADFEKEMKDAGAQAEVKVYPTAKHAFTNPDADKAGLDALKYDAQADRESFEKAVPFLQAAVK